jgi:hypothetical protein
MAYTGATGIFGSVFSSVDVVARAGDCSMSFSYDGTDYRLAAQDVSIQYSEPIQWQVLQAGRMLGTISKATGAIQIGSLLGDGLTAFLARFGAATSLADSATPLIISELTDITATSVPSAKLGIINSATFNCYNTKVVNAVFVNNVRETLISTQVQLFVLNLNASYAAV